MPISNQVVGRLAPSPTGAQHLGNARTYLLAWLAARSAGGRVILRIEDIDSPRVKPWATEQAMDDLRWLGLDWDEGPDIGGPHGPYIQTTKANRYQVVLQELVAAGKAYPCVCSRQDIATAASAPHPNTDTATQHDHEGPVYPGTCAAWQIGDPLPPQGSYCWRYRATDRIREFVDLVHGRQQLNVAKELGDFPLTRKTGEAAYQLAVVIDDIEMTINQVVRGDDLIASTFRQLDLFEALHAPPPQFAHVPLVLGPDGRRLAKRHGDTRLSQYREAGIDPRQIIGWAAASSGLIEKPVCSRPDELIDSFCFERLDRQATHINDAIFRDS
ncbi:Glutamate--tRNA ligase 1 [Roseimaritima multifibrata]|uniref:Glutamate--tRNA ligase 1 n=1 Tax=Roseimaritima multifibrata TaxID=1930274 RepID=A0A517MB86_9BACT|nr:tRNA glutamyl-Q(34) synthetase GluQRS [Roseimaritima multifibrata]QDS92149.1 Glutamate--tRNA ligase 1 [Roseimaritima multifibrata]